MSELKFKIAKVDDAGILTKICKVAFDDFSRKHGGNSEGGPPGYDSVEYQIEKMKEAPYLKILLDEEIVGGMLLIPKEPGHMMLGRIFIHPAHQNKGIGTRAIEYIEEAYPAEKWSLETPTYAPENHRFYERLGYVRKGIVPDIPEPLFLYEKHVKK